MLSHRPLLITSNGDASSGDANICGERPRTGGDANGVQFLMKKQRVDDPNLLKAFMHAGTERHRRRGCSDVFLEQQSRGHGQRA